jgi:hypothetical protein
LLRSLQGWLRSYSFCRSKVSSAKTCSL